MRLKLANLKIVPVLLAVVSLTGCSRQADYEPGCLRMNLGAEPPSLDWHVSVDSTSFDVVSNLMVGLTQYDNQLRCQPACAVSWEVLQGGRHYRFHLRPDVRWSDGRLVTARDFEYAWKRLLNPQTAAQYAYFLYDIENAFEYNTGKIKDAALVGVKAADAQTLDVYLKNPAAYFLYLTAFCPTYPQRQDVVERWQSAWTEPEHMVTNGPFKLSKWEHEYKIELLANPLFFEGEPRLQKLKLFMIPEQSTAFALYENNQLDYVDNRSFSTADVERFKHSPEYRNLPLLRNNYLGFNVNKKPFTDVRVRQAVSMAIDRRIFARILRRGERPAYSWIPPSMAGYQLSSGVEFNPQLARDLLKQAGYENAGSLPAVELLYPQREDTRLVVEAIQDELKRNLGLQVKLVNQEWKVYLQTLHRSPPPLFRQSWGADYPDPETFMNLFTSHNGNNNTNFKSREYDDLIAAAAGEQDVSKRDLLYARADKLLCREQAVIAPTFLSTQNLMIKPWVKGMEFNALDIQFFKNVFISQPGAKGL